MKDYLILYNLEIPIKFNCENELSAIIELFAYYATPTVFTSQELKEIGEKYGVDKIIKLFEQYEGTKIAVFEVEQKYGKQYGVEQ